MTIQKFSVIITEWKEHLSQCFFYIKCVAWTVIYLYRMFWIINLNVECFIPTFKWLFVLKCTEDEQENDVSTKLKWSQFYTCFKIYGPWSNRI